MRILLDHNVSVPLRYALVGHNVEVAFERGWARLFNGDLLAAVETEGFDLLITSDQGIRYQQNWSSRKLALLVLSTNDWTRIRPVKARVLASVNAMPKHGFAELQIPALAPPTR